MRGMRTLSIDVRSAAGTGLASEDATVESDIWAAVFIAAARVVSTVLSRTVALPHYSLRGYVEGNHSRLRQSVN